jgi:streptomycin 3"-adenylyltransferase
LKQAMLATVESLQADLASDTTNVLLTLARIAYSLESNAFITKDAAAEWAAPRIRQGARLRRAAAIYRGEAADEWAPSEADQAARELMELIRG